VGRAEVDWWKGFRRELGREPAADDSIQPNPRFQPNASGNDVATELQNNLEEFEDVQVISFGWVALFILVYILIVGPLDYLFLKKVVKRLELTWVTFPLVVVIVSAAAYLSASALKGNEQKINKLDLVDYDLRTKTVQGTT